MKRVVKRCNGILISLFKFRHYFSQDAIKILIQTYVFPHITYCLCVWGGAAKGLLHKIQKLINFAARIVTGFRKHQHITPALNSLEWPRIEALVARRDLLKVFKALRCDDSPVAIRSLFTQRSDTSLRETRASERGDLQLPRCRLSATQRAFPYRAARAWNDLSPAVRELAAVRSFRRTISDAQFTHQSVLVCPVSLFLTCLC